LRSSYSDVAQRVSIERLSRAGAIVVDVEAVISEFQQTWAREDALAWGALHANVIPSYHALIESVLRAQAEAGGGEGSNAEVEWAKQRGQLSV
jgi:hypothetical protein